MGGAGRKSEECVPHRRLSCSGCVSRFQVRGIGLGRRGEGFLVGREDRRIRCGGGGAGRRGLFRRAPGERRRNEHRQGAHGDSVTRHSPHALTLGQGAAAAHDLSTGHSGPQNAQTSPAPARITPPIRHAGGRVPRLSGARSCADPKLEELCAGARGSAARRPGTGRCADGDAQTGKRRRGNAQTGDAQTRRRTDGGEAQTSRSAAWAACRSLEQCR